jgi:hypothetical protein
MRIDDPLFPLRWAIWWQGSGPQPGMHVMELTGHDLSYSREIAYLGAGVDKPQQDHMHAEVEKLVREHNLIVDRLRAAIVISTPAPLDRRSNPTERKTR